MKAPRSILVVVTRRIGDVLLATPGATVVRSRSQSMVPPKSSNAFGVPDPADDSIVWWGTVREGEPPRQIIEGGEYFVLKKIGDGGGGHHH